MRFARNIRITACAMAAVMLLSSIPAMAVDDGGTTAALTDTDITQTANERISTPEYDALNTMGFLCDDFGMYGEGDTITRAQFAVSIARLGGMRVSSHTSDEIPFIDVNTTSKYADEICTLYEYGYVSGTGDRTFEPDAVIEYSQAVKLCVDLLGYRQYTAAKYGDYPSGYVLMANALGLDEGVSAKNVLAAADAAQLLYNTARTYVLTESAYDADGNVTYGKNDREELLEYIHDIHYDEGDVTDNAIVSLTNGDTSGKIIIGGRNLNSNDVDMTDLIGCRVDYFYRSHDGSNTLLWAGIDKKCSVKTLSCDDLVPTDAKNNASNVVYIDNGKTRNLALDKYVSIIYNNRLDNGYMPIAPKTGIVRFIDRDDDGKYDVVAVLEFRNLSVNTVSHAANIITGKYGESLKCDDYDSVTFIKNGVKATIEDIPGKCIVSYIVSGDKKHLYVYINSDGGSGVLQSVNDDDSKKIYTVNGKDFKVSATFDDVVSEGKYYTDEITPGVKYIYYLDMAGEIADMFYFDGGKMKYAYLFNICEDDEVFGSKSALIRLFTEDGDKMDAVAADKLTIDGIKNKSGIDLLADSRLIDANGDVIEQIVKVAFDNEGCVSEIDIAEKSTNEYGYDESQFTLDFDGKASYRPAPRTLGYKYQLYNNTLIFYRPHYSSDDEEIYLLRVSSSLFNSASRIRLYDLDNTLSPSACLVDADTIAKDERIVLVDKITRVLDSNGNERKRVSGYSYGLKWEATEKEEDIIPDGLKRGDVISVFTLNESLLGVKRLCSLSEHPEPFRDSSFSSVSSVYGQIYGVNSQGIITVNPESMQEKYGKLLLNSFNGGRFSTRIQAYDAVNDKVYPAKKSDITALSSPDENGDLPDDGGKIMIYLYRKHEMILDAVIVYY